MIGYQWRCPFIKFVLTLSVLQREFNIQVEMQRMWQRDDKTLAVRWNVQGSPRLIGGMTGGKVRLDGISEYKFNDEGKVYKHTVDVINWNGLHSVLGLKSLQLSSKLMPTPSC